MALLPMSRTQVLPPRVASSDTTPVGREGAECLSSAGWAVGVQVPPVPQRRALLLDSEDENLTSYSAFSGSPPNQEHQGESLLTAEG